MGATEYLTQKNIADQKTLLLVNIVKSTLTLRVVPFGYTFADVYNQEKM